MPGLDLRHSGGDPRIHPAEGSPMATQATGAANEVRHWRDHLDLL
jgi:hypothetical protein